jgi:hypothetical protein
MTVFQNASEDHNRPYSGCETFQPDIIIGIVFWFSGEELRAMPDIKDKTISYRKAEWFIDHCGALNLGQCVKQACDRLTTVEDRSLYRSNRQKIKLASYQRRDDGSVLLHITAETPGEGASAIPHSAPTDKEVLVETVQPPDSKELMDGWRCLCADPE